MFAKYKDNIYLYIKNRRMNKIITRSLQKINPEFKKDDDGVFYKAVSESELADVFNVEFWVSYNTGLPNTPLYWQVDLDEQDSVNGKILLRFSEGILPNWEIEEKNVCKKYVDVSELKEAKIIYVYKKRNNIIYSPPQKVEENIPIDKMLILFKKY